MNVKAIRALDRGLTVMKVLNESPGLSLAALSSRTELPKATLRRILHTLESANWVYQRRCDRSYRLSYRVCDMGQGLLSSDRLAELSAPYLDDLQTKVGWPSDIATVSGTRISIHETTRCADLGREAVMDPGLDVPLLATGLGRAYLAASPFTERALVVDRLRGRALAEDGTRPGPRWIGQLIARTERQGYARSDPDFWARFLCCAQDVQEIAVPVMLEGRVHSCINLVWDARECGHDEVDTRCLPELRHTARAIARAVDRAIRDCH